MLILPVRLLLLRDGWRCQDLGLSFLFLTSCGIRVLNLLTTQWKKYLTTMQITQFVIDLFIVYFAGLYTRHLQRKAYTHEVFLDSLPPSGGFRVDESALHGGLQRNELSCYIRVHNPDLISLPVRRLLLPYVQACSKGRCWEGQDCERERGASQVVMNHR